MSLLFVHYLVLLSSNLHPYQRIILVGGFGESEYLRRALVSTFETTGKIAVTIPDNP